MLDRLEKRIERTYPISPNQIGFRKGHRTGDHIFVLKSIVDKITKGEKKKLFAAFIDFRKAYDTVNRSLLLLRIQRLGIKGLFYRNIKAMYNSISYLVKVQGGHLNAILSNCGLKQGGVLSPLLFNLYIDHIKDIFNESCDPITLLNEPLSHMLYADDLVLLSTSESGLKNCLSKLGEFCEKWQLELNISKSKVLIFNPSGRITKGISFEYRGMPLDIVNSYCYLGIDFSSSGSLALARNNLMEKAQKAMYSLNPVIAQFHVPVDKALNMFHSMIQPIALYNAENLAQLTQHQITAITENKSTLLSYMITSYPNTTHQKFLKYILGVKRNCSNLVTIGELGEFPLILNGFTSLLSFWHRCSLMNDGTLVRQALNLVTSDTYNSEWISTVKLLLSYLDMDDHFVDPTLSNTDSFTLACKCKLRDKFVQEWALQISREEGKLRFYKLIKKNFKLEPYLLHVNDFGLRKTITKFRGSDHTLEIEVGRHKKLEVTERICKICNKDVETELHFLKSCPKYSELRNRYLNVLNAHNLIDVLQCDDKSTSFNVANFLQKAMKIRKSTLASPESPFKP